MKHHVYKSKPGSNAYYPGNAGYWFHCNRCPCHDEEPSDDHSDCLDTDPEVITMMVETGMFKWKRMKKWWLK